MKKDFLLKALLAIVTTSVGAFAEMTVDKSNGVLTVTSDISGTVIAKVIGPNNEVVVNEKYEGNSFSWTASGVDGIYRYEIRVISTQNKIKDIDELSRMNDIQLMEKKLIGKQEYTRGSIKIYNGKMKEQRSK